MPGFQDLDVWNKAHQLTLSIYEVTEDFPSKEKYRLVDQLCRSAASVPANIAEGKGRTSEKEFIHFLEIARGSVEETKYHLLLASDLNYISEEKYQNLWRQSRDVGKMINGLISKMNRDVDS